MRARVSSRATVPPLKKGKLPPYIYMNLQNHFLNIYIWGEGAARVWHGCGTDGTGSRATCVAFALLAHARGTGKPFARATYPCHYTALNMLFLPIISARKSISSGGLTPWHGGTGKR